MEKKRIYWIDALKGFATLLVVWGHIFDGYSAAAIFSEHSSFIHEGRRLIYSFHMPLFFIISGYVFRMAYFKNGKKKPSLKKQMINIVILYVVFSVLFGTFKVLMGKFANSDVSFTDVLMIPVKAISPYWYLYVLLAYYLIFSSEFMLNVKNDYILLAILAAVSVLSTFISNNIGVFFEIKHTLYMMLFFYIGVFLCKNSIAIMKKWYISLDIFISAIVLMVVFFKVSKQYSDIPLCNVIVASGISLMLCGTFQSLFDDDKKLMVRFFSFIGRYSLEIYLIHCVFTAGNRVVLAKLHIDNFYLNIICNFIISTSLPVIFAIICKKINIHGLIFRPVGYFQKKENVN